MEYPKSLIIAGITDRGSLTIWLESQSGTVQLAVAARGALRTLGGLGSAQSGQLGEIALTCMRTAMTACLAAIQPSDQLRMVASKLGGLTSRMATDATMPEFKVARAVNCAALASLPEGTEIPTAGLEPTRWTQSTGSIARNAAQVVAIVANDAPHSFQESIFGAASKDAELFESGVSAKDIIGMPLWAVAAMPWDVSAGIEQLYAHFSADPETWQFWRDWYQGFLDGKPLDWELQRRVAMILDEDWDRGPDHVAALIEEIKARLEVQRNAESVGALLAATDLFPAGMGHNNPPEAIDDLPLSPDDLADTERLIARILREAESSTPDKNALRDAAKWIGRILWKATVWFARKADVAAEEFAKKLGSFCAVAALPAFVWALGQMPKLLDGLAELAKSLDTWLQLLK